MRRPSMSFPSTVLLLAGCLVAPTRVAAAEAAWLGWGEMIGEPELDAIIASSLDQSSSIASSRVSTRVRELESRLARVSRYPKVDLGVALRAGREDTASTGFQEADVAPWDLGGTARLDLDVFGALKARSRRAFEAERVAAFELYDHELDWAAALARLLVQLRYQEAEVEIRAALVDTHQVARDWARGREAAGLLAASELDAYEARLLRARQDQVAASERVAVLQTQWQYLAAANRPPEPPPSENPLGIPALPPPEALHEQAMNRPDVQAARATWDQAIHHADASRKTRRPTLSAVAAARGEGPSPVEDPDEWTAWAGLQLAIPLWVPEDKARADRDREQVGFEEALYQDAIRSALQDLRQTYARCRHGEKIWAMASDETVRIRDRLNTTQRKLDQGLIMQVDLETARNQWLAATDQERRARAALLRHHIDLARAGGGPGS